VSATPCILTSNRPAYGLVRASSGCLARISIGNFCLSPGYKAAFRMVHEVTLQRATDRRCYMSAHLESCRPCFSSIVPPSLLAHLYDILLIFAHIAACSEVSDLHMVDIVKEASRRSASARITSVFLLAFIRADFRTETLVTTPKAPKCLTTRRPPRQR
jgi:hypothetical protein